MDIRKLLLIILIFATNVLMAQSYNYSTNSGNLGTTYSWIDCSSGTEVIDSEWKQNNGLGDKKDDGYAELNWPFNFQFYDSYYFAGEKLYLCTNGFIRFDAVPDDDATNTYNNDIDGYSPNLGEILAFALEDAGLEDDNSTVHYLTTGSSPNRVFTIEIQNLEIRFNQEKYVDVEMSFYETSNIVVLKVGNYDVASANTTYLGIHSGNSTYKNQWGELQAIGQDKWREYTPPAKAYSGITITQASSANVYPSDNNEVVRIQVDITGGGGAFNFTRLAVKEVNDDNADVSNVKIFHTKTTTFSTDHQVATTQTAVNSYNNYVFKNFSYDMPGGTSYLWVAYSVATAATNGNTIGAQIRKNKITLDGSKYPAAHTGNFTRDIGYFEWDGSTSTDWNVGSNWSNGSVPTSADNVIIPSAPANQPHILSGDSDECGDMKIESGASVTVDDGGYLDVYGNVDNRGTFAGGDEDVWMRGTDNTIGGAGVYSTVSFNLQDPTNYTILDNVSCNRIVLNSNAVLIVGDNSFSCSGKLEALASSTLTIASGIVAVAGVVTLSGTFTPGTGTFYYSGNNSQSIINTSYHKLKVKVSAGTRTLTNVSNNCKSLEIIGAGTSQMAADIDIDDDYKINAGCTLDMNSHSINLSGDWTNNGTLTPGTQTVTFDGIGSSHMYGNTDFYNITLNKSTGDLYSDGTNHITHTLSLTKGVLFSSSNTSVIVDAGATVSGGGTTSYVDGPMRKDGNTAFTFPVGDFRKYAPCAVGAPSASTQFVAEYVKAGHSDNGNFLSPLTKVSLNEYWNITPSSAVTADVRIYWRDGDWSGIGNLSDLRMAHYNGSAWENLSSASTSGSTSSGSIVKSAVSSFSPFTFGTIDNVTNPLPVSLVYFEAEKINNTAVLFWKTASEISNDYFIIQRSIDGVDVEDVAIIKGAGNSNVMLNYKASDNNPPNTKVYYRIKQVDYDGKFEIFSWKMLDFSSQKELSVYPNPNTGGLISFANGGSDSKASVMIFAMDGKLVLDKELSFSGGRANLLHDLNKGYYMIKIVQNNEVVVRKLIVQ